MPSDSLRERFGVDAAMRRALADHGPFADFKTLAAYAGYSVPTVQRAMKRLLPKVGRRQYEPRQRKAA